MGLVYEDGEGTPAMFAPDFIHDERELLHGGDDDLLAVREELAEVGGFVRVPDGRGDLRELLYGLAQLVIQYDPVGDDHHRVEDGLAVLFKPNELVGEPGYRVALATPGGVLD